MRGLFSRHTDDFDEWAESLNLTEEDLTDLYHIAKRRSILFGILSFTALGFLFAPFWLCASGFARAIRYRSFNVRQNVFVSLIFFVWGIMSLFIYPLIVMWVVIPITHWCIRTDGKDVFVPFLTILVFALIGLAVITPIPLVAVVTLYLMIRCFRSGHAALAVLILALGLTGGGVYLLASNHVKSPSPQAFLDRLPENPVESVQNVLSGIAGDIAALPGEIISTWKDPKPSDSGVSVSNGEQIVPPHEELPAGVEDGSALSDGQNGEGGQIPADTLDPQENAYLWPTNSQYITDADLDGFSRKEIMLMRNELYARYGCSFRDEEIRNYFLSRDWYTPDPELLAVNFSIELFNDYEKSNLNTILSYERMKGWRE